MVGCACSSWNPDDGLGIEAFASIRADCSALRMILVPDSLWDDFEAWHGQLDDASLHRSILLLALQRGYLAAIVSPVHRYLVCQGEMSSKVTKQYKTDLREDWWCYSDPAERHQKARMYSGRLAELQFAEWLEEQGWRVENLEALGADSDIEAMAPNEVVATSFEVKLIGVEDTDFECIVRSLAGSPAGHHASPYDAANYLLFRAYEAAVQLRRNERGRRIVVVVVDDMAWPEFEVQIREGWIDWSRPGFLRGDHLSDFLAGQLSRYPELLSNLADTLHAVDELWILRREDGYRHVCELIQPLACLTTQHQGPGGE
ncbi:MAG: hypothetical protein FD171_543 [Actinobacteria bacterium]|nr:MAG: hypothetical protein FD171_543 [Actinomycetota bacterium]